MAFDEKAFRDHFAGKASQEAIDAEVAKQKSYETQSAAPKLDGVIPGAMPPVQGNSVEQMREEAKKRNAAAVASSTTSTPVGDIPTNMLTVGGAMLGSAALGAGGMYLYNKHKNALPSFPQITPQALPQAAQTPQSFPPITQSPIQQPVQTSPAMGGGANPPSPVNTPQVAPQDPQTNPLGGLQEKLAAAQAATQPQVQVAPPAKNPLITPESPLANPEFPHTGTPVTVANSPIDANGQLKVPDSLDKSNKLEPTINSTKLTPQQKLDRQTSQLNPSPERTAIVQSYAQNNLPSTPEQAKKLAWIHGAAGNETANLMERVGITPASSWEDIYAATKKYNAGELGHVPRVSGATPSENFAPGRPGAQFEGIPPDYPKGQLGKTLTEQAAILAALSAAVPIAHAGYSAYQNDPEAAKKHLGDAWDSVKGLVTGPYEAGKQALQGNFAPAGQMTLQGLAGSNPAGFAALMAHHFGLENKFGNFVQAQRVGAGRGVAPPSSYQR